MAEGVDGRVDGGRRVYDLWHMGPYILAGRLDLQ